MDVATEVVLDLGLGRIGGGVVDHGLAHGSNVGAILVHGLELIGNHGDAEHLVASADAYLLAEISRCVHKERSGKCGHLDGELALLVGHGRIVAVVERLYLDTGKGLLRYGVDDDTLDVHRRVLGLLHLSFLLDDSLLHVFGVFHVVVLCHSGQADGH